MFWWLDQWVRPPGGLASLQEEVSRTLSPRDGEQPNAQGPGRWAVAVPTLTPLPVGRGDWGCLGCVATTRHVWIGSELTQSSVWQTSRRSNCAFLHTYLGTQNFWSYSRNLREMMYFPPWLHSGKIYALITVSDPQECRHDFKNLKLVQTCFQ